MTRDPAPPARARAPVWLRPWPLLVGGLGATFLGLVLLALPGEFATLLRVLLIASGLIMAGVAIRRRFQTADKDLEERIESAGVLALAAFIALVAYVAVGDTWEASRMVLGVAVALALFAAGVWLLPRLARRVIVSVVVLFHFVGILAAVTSVPPPNGTAPWLSVKLWGHVYRPYLGFVYLTNAYHFYSPDPGPPTLLWFRIYYEDGMAQWKKIPNREESPLGLSYQRMLALTESTNSTLANLPLTRDQIPAYEQEMQMAYDHDPWEEILHRRQIGATQTKPEAIQIVDDVPLTGQYREPDPYAKKLLSSYARHVLLNAPPHPKDPSIPATTVKVYRLTHNIIPPAELARGMSPLDKTRYVPFFQGEFDRTGKLVDPREPFLYWYLPIVVVPKDYPRSPIRVNVPPPKDGRLLNSLEIHAGEVSQ